MKLLKTQITRENVNNLIRNSFDSAHKNHPDQLRERYIFMNSDFGDGFLCVEGNTNGWFILGQSAGLSNALAFLEGKL